MRVDRVVSVASNMVAGIDDAQPGAPGLSELTSDNAAGETGAYYENILLLQLN